MENINLPRLVFAAPQSSSGKTTIVTGFLAALNERAIKVQPYKVGPDYIDPTYHALAAKRQGHNLDTWLVQEEKLAQLFASTAKDADFSVIEGVMGLFDGGKGGISSTAQIAKKLKASVVLVINCRSMGESAAALALGYQKYDADLNFAGVILNGLGSASHEAMIKEAMARQGIKVFGAVRRNEELKMPERHLGLTPANERDARAQIERLVSLIAPQLDIDGLLALGKTAPALALKEKEKLPALQPTTVAIAHDAAFSFYYPASLRVLEKMGARFVTFSPLADEALPPCDAAIFGGGFPEVFAEKLSQNKSFLNSLRQRSAEGLPIYGECGGFMYLTEAIEDFSGKVYQMAGLIPARTKMEKKLQTVGYVTARFLDDCLLGKAGSELKGHEFHFSVQEGEERDFPFAYEFTKNRTQQKYLGGYHKDNILASYLHIHFLGAPEAAENLLRNALCYQKKRAEAGGKK